MHVLCPSCTTAYEIPPLQRPRKLRCARCAAEWKMLPEQDETEPAMPSAEASTADTGPDRASEGITLAPLEALPLLPAGAGRLSADATAPSRTDTLPWTTLWVLSLVVIVAWVAALWHWRGAIGHAWSPSLRLYRLLPGAIVVPAP